LKRFYQKVTVEKVEDYFTVALDGSSMRTPGMNTLSLTTEKLANSIASEWRQQGTTIKPDKMPLMSLATTAIDRVAPQKMGVVKSIVAYGETDLLCYRAFEPEELVARQNNKWQPILEWAKTVIGAELHVTGGIMPLQQPLKSINAIRDKITHYDSFNLTGLHELTIITDPEITVNSCNPVRLKES
jgi:chaperone required for assembly of F1-ATPase